MTPSLTSGQYRALKCLRAGQPYGTVVTYQNLLHMGLIDPGRLPKDRTKLSPQGDRVLDAALELDRALYHAWRVRDRKLKRQRAKKGKPSSK